MAIFDGKFIRGVIGDVVFRKVGNKQRMSRRMVRGTIRQTAETKKAANTFGLASSLGAHLRDVLKADFKGFVDTNMHNRLTAELCRIFNQCRDPESGTFSFEKNSFSELVGFDFNNQSALKISLGAKPVVSMENGSLDIFIPFLHKIKFPSFAISCEMTVSVALIALEEGIKAQHPDRKRILIEKNLASRDPYQFKFDIPQGCFCVVSLFLDFYMNYKNYIKMVNNKQFSPAAICGAMISPGKFELNDSRFWVEI